MDPLYNPLRTRPIKTSREKLMEPDGNRQFGFIDHPDRKSGCGSVPTRTRTRSHGPDPLLTLGPGGLSTAERRLNLKRGENAQVPGPAATFASSMSDRRLILRPDESIPLPQQMYEESALAVNRALFQQQAPAHVRITNGRGNANGTLTAITGQNSTAATALLYRDIIINTARSVDTGIIDVEGNKSWETLKIHTVPLVRYMCKATQRLLKIKEKIQAENEGVAIPAQV